jgi:putative peptidoglycan lipid II flippase
MYCIGLPAFAAVGVLTRSFYALGDTRRPVQASFVSVALNIALNLALMRPLGHVGLALATSATSIANLLQLGFYLRRRIGPLEGGRNATMVLRVLAAGTISAALCGLGLVLIGDVGEGLARRVLVVLGGLLLGVTANIAVLRALRVAEIGVLEELARSLAGRVFRR